MTAASPRCGTCSSTTTGSSAESRVDGTIYPLSEHGLELPPGGPLHVPRPGAALRALSPADARGVRRALNGLAIERLPESLNAAAEAEQFAAKTRRVRLARRTPPGGSIGYTRSYREPSADVVEVSVVSVLEARRRIVDVAMLAVKERAPSRTGVGWTKIQ